MPCRRAKVTQSENSRFLTCATPAVRRFACLVEDARHLEPTTTLLPSPPLADLDASLEEFPDVSPIATASKNDADGSGAHALVRGYSGFCFRCVPPGASSILVVYQLVCRVWER